MIKTGVSHIHADEQDPQLIKPIDFNGVKAMSYGFASAKNAIVRGPIASNLVT